MARTHSEQEKSPKKEVLIAGCVVKTHATQTVEQSQEPWAYAGTNPRAGHKHLGHRVVEVLGG